MSITVPDSVVAKATKCVYGHSCLATGKCGDHDLCDIQLTNGENVLFLKDNEHAECPYRMSFGDGQICRCPVHYYIRTHKLV